LSFARSPTRINRRVSDSESLEWSVSFEHGIGLFAGNTAKAVGTLPPGAALDGIAPGPERPWIGA
jgi:hypothetical protein